MSGRARQHQQYTDWRDGDGAETVFRLSRKPFEGSLLVFSGNILQRPNELAVVHDYAFDGEITVPFTIAPGAGDDVCFSYASV